MLAEISEAARALRQSHGEGRKIRRLSAQSVVHRGAHDLRAHHVRERCHGGGDHADQEPALAPPEKPPEQGPFPGFFD